MFVARSNGVPFFRWLQYVAYWAAYVTKGLILSRTIEQSDGGVLKQDRVRTLS